MHIIVMFYIHIQEKNCHIMNVTLHVSNNKDRAFTTKRYCFVHNCHIVEVKTSAHVNCIIFTTAHLTKKFWKVCSIIYKYIYKLVLINILYIINNLKNSFMLLLVCNLNKHVLFLSNSWMSNSKTKFCITHFL